MEYIYMYFIINHIISYVIKIMLVQRNCNLWTEISNKINHFPTPK